MVYSNLIQRLYSDAFAEDFVSRKDLGQGERPAYAYGMYEAAVLAHRLGYERLSAVEFGVAGGSGLVAMERLADEIERIIPIEFEVYGFDLGTGLPSPVDYRDLPHIFRAGEYSMDEQLLRRRLARATLVLGDVADTVPKFVESFSPAPIGFAAIDLDFYSSTAAALAILESESILPRVHCYFDDIIWPAGHNEFVGELLAIREFNDRSVDRDIAPIYGLRHIRNGHRRWSSLVATARVGISLVVPDGSSFVLVGGEEIGYDTIGASKAYPFTERDGQFGGLPVDSEAAISEVERMRQKDTSFIVIVPSSFWVLDYYDEFRKHLEVHHTCVLDTPYLIVFRLDCGSKGSGSDGPADDRLVTAYCAAAADVTNGDDEHWNDEMFLLHAFTHPRYTDFVSSEQDKQLPITSNPEERADYRNRQFPLHP